MREDKIRKLRKLGFTVSEQGRNGSCFVSMELVPSKDLVLQMIRILDFEDWVRFWDHSYPSPTDPGGYVSSYVLDKNRVVYNEGNHGWSSNYKQISADEFADLIITNWDKDCDGGLYLNRIQISPQVEAQRDKYLYNIK